MNERDFRLCKLNDGYQTRKKVLHKMMDVIRLGDPVRITDHAGRSVSYERGAYGERKGMTYPDGTEGAAGGKRKLRLFY